MTRDTVREIIAFSFYMRRKEAQDAGLGNYGNEETDQIQAEAVIKFFTDETVMSEWEREKVYEDYRCFEGLVKEIE